MKHRTRLAGGDGRRRGVHLDRPLRPAVPHPPGQPPRHPRRLRAERLASVARTALSCPGTAVALQVGEEGDRPLDAVGHVPQEAAGHAAVADPVVEGERQLGHLAHAPAGPSTTHGLSMIRPTPSMRRLRVVDDRRRAVDAEHAVVVQRERAAGQLRRASACRRGRRSVELAQRARPARTSSSSAASWTTGTTRPAVGLGGEAQVDPRRAARSPRARCRPGRSAPGSARSPPRRSGPAAPARRSGVGSRRCGSRPRPPSARSRRRRPRWSRRGSRGGCVVSFVGDGPAHAAQRDAQVVRARSAATAATGAAAVAPGRSAWRDAADVGGDRAPPRRGGAGSRPGPGAVQRRQVDAVLAGEPPHDRRDDLDRPRGSGCGRLRRRDARGSRRCRAGRRGPGCRADPPAAGALALGGAVPDQHGARAGLLLLAVLRDADAARAAAGVRPPRSLPSAGRADGRTDSSGGADGQHLPRLAVQLVHPARRTGRARRRWPWPSRPRPRPGRRRRRHRPRPASRTISASVRPSPRSGSRKTARCVATLMPRHRAKRGPGVVPLQPGDRVEDPVDAGQVDVLELRRRVGDVEPADPQHRRVQRVEAALLHPGGDLGADTGEALRLLDRPRTRPVRRTDAHDRLVVERDDACAGRPPRASQPSSCARLGGLEGDRHASARRRPGSRRGPAPTTAAVPNGAVADRQLDLGLAAK